MQDIGIDIIFSIVLYPQFIYCIKKIMKPDVPDFVNIFCL